MIPLQIPGAIALFSGSGPYLPSHTPRLRRLLAPWGLTVHLRSDRPHRHPRLTHLSGSDEERRADLEWALSTPECQAAWASRGGYGLARLLPAIDWDGLKVRPVIGFSDVTALQWALYRRGWRDCVHGPNAHNLKDYHSPITLAALRDLLLRDRRRPWPVEVWQGGELEGPLVGGNVNVLAGLCGTPEALVGRGLVLFLEEVREIPYRLDHNLTQLLSSGSLRDLRGIVLGEFKNCGRPELVRQILRDRLLPLGVPVVGRAPAGHGNIFRAFVQGGRVQLQGSKLVFESRDSPLTTKDRTGGT